MAAELATSLTPATDAERLLQAEATVRGFCGWHIAPVRDDAEETVDAPCGRERLYLKTLQLVEVTDMVGGSVAFDAADYNIDTAQGWVQPAPGHCWPYAASGRLTIVYSHGFEDVPADVTRAVQAVAAQGASNPGALRRIQTGPFLEDYSSGGGGGSVSDLLAPYVLPVV